MKRENNKKFKKRKRNQNRSLTCRVLSMMFAIVLFCSTVLINTDYVSQASSFDDMVDMVEVEEDSAAADTSEDTGDDLGTDVNFESESEEGSAETYSESDDFGSSDADFSSGENMFTDGTSESSAPAEEAAQPVSCIVKLKNETIEVKAEAPAGVLPNGTQMIVKAVENNTEDAELTDQYNKLAAKITEQLQSQGKNLDGFLAYNVSFTDADGNPVEPSDKVTYSFIYKEASSPELTDPAASTVTAAMIRTNKETSELELTELKAEEDKLTVETNESRQLTKAAFQSAATAAYTFVWSSTPAADDNENTENKEENGEVNNEEVNTDTNTENTEENEEETNTENNVENSEEEQNPEEAPDQEQTKMIRVIADEVNLRVTPSTEAEVIATVDTDTQLPLIETVTDEDEFTWYKVSYEEAEAYVRSDMAEVVETEEQGTENEDANEEEADVQIEEVTYSQTIGNVVVTATAAKDVLPDDAQFVVTPIEQGTDQYAETETKLNEKAEEDGYEIAGFLAYDIYFQDSEGNKIEPVDGSVNVSMHYTEPSVPEEVTQVTENGSEAAVFTEEDEFSQNETTATQMDITMMHLVEDENGNVNVVDMTQEGTASVETDAAGNVQKAEFETESFSIFTITWNVSAGKILTVHLVDTNLDDIQGSVTANESVQSDRAGIEVSTLGTKYLPEGYTYTGALADDKETEISAISYNSYSHGKSGWFYEKNNNWYHATTADTYDIYLVYNKLSVWIKDDIMNTGNLILETDEDTTNEINNAITAGKEVTYTWLKSTDGGANYTAVNKVKHGDNYNLSEDGKSLNVALDDGALNSKQTSVKYKAKITIKNGDNDIKEMESEPFNNKYWNELQNGSFETPEIISGDINEQYTNEEYVAADGVWQSTGRGTNSSGKAVDIEIVNTRASFQSSYSWHAANDNDKAFDGNQFAELNCQNAGALYQDVMTYAGETMNYWLSHRARGAYPYGGTINGEKDTMYLVIMPTSTAMTAADGRSELKTQTQLNAYINSVLTSKYGPSFNIEDEAQGDENQRSEILYNNDNNDGILISRITSDDQSWHRILETARYRSTSYLTRFFFMSGKTASGSPTVGNFLDDVGFSQKLPKASDGEFNLQVVKRFSGLSNPTGNITFTIKAYKENGTEEAKDAPLNNTSFTLDKMKNTSDGVYTKIFQNEQIGGDEKYIYKVEETGSQVNGYTVETTQTVSGGDVQSDGKSTKIGEKDSATFTITNTYTPIDINSVIEYNKTATLLDWNQRTYKIDLTASSKTTQSMKIPYDIVLVLDQSGSMSHNFVEYQKIGSSMSEAPKKTYYVKTQNGIYQQLSRINNGSIWNPKYTWSYTNSYTGETVTVDSKTTDVYEAKTSNQTKIAALKTAATNFVNNVADKNSDCRVGIVTFSNDGYIKPITNNSYTLAKVGTSKDDIINTIGGLRTGGDTRPAKGLDKAREIFSEASSGSWENVDQTDGRRKMVVFLTDGVPAPANTDDFDENLAEAGTYSATQLHNLGAETYALGIFGAADSNGTMNTASVKRIDEYMQSIASSHEKYMTADSVGNLSSLFESITNNIPVTATVTDVIDSRFELTDDSRKQLEADGATIRSNDGFTTITWNDASITGKKASGETEIERAGWHRSIVIKAKDNYIGGNDVPTNGAGSGIDVDNNHAEFPQPTVNVKVDFKIGNNETVIFKGDDLTNYFTDNVEKGITKLVSTTETEYTMLDDVNVSTKWYIDEACTTEISPDAIRAAKPTAETVYYAKVTVTPKTDGSASSANSKGDKTNGDYYKVDSTGVVNTEPGTYTVKVVSGQIQITKKIDVVFDEDQSFTFEIKKGDKPIATATAEIKKGSTEANVKYTLAKGVDSQIKADDSDESILTGLSRGAYTITEVADDYYSLDTVTVVDSTNCKAEVSNDKVLTFIMGTDKGGNEVLNGNNTDTVNGRIVVAEFNNKKSVVDIEFEKVDIQTPTTKLPGAKFALYKADADGNQTNEQVGTTYTSDSNGGIAIENLPIGKYVLVETKAPAGYLCSTIPWEIEVANSRTITVTYNGNRVEPSNNIYQLTNTKVYTLPSTGGSGIYWYMIGGMVLMSTAAWILYKNKCREVLGK